MTEWKLRRFWREATVRQENEGWSVRLDGRPLRTPAKSELILPSERLAIAVKGEWDAQGEEIQPSTMPFTRSANSAIDRVMPQQADVVALVAAYGESDLLCYRADAPEGLIARQAEAWDPLLAWAATTLSAPLRSTAGIVHVDQPVESVAALRGAVEALTPFELTAFHDLVALSGSLVIGFAAMSNFRSADDLWQISRIDETWQAEQWGQDEEAVIAAEAKRQDFLHAARFIALVQKEGASSNR